MFEKLKKLFRKDTTVTKTIDFGLSLAAPGAEFKLPAVAIAPVIAPVVAQPIGHVVKVEPGICHACGQVIQPKTAPVVDPAILNQPWNDLDRVDLEPRTSTQIQLLIAAGETPDNREKRIWNDKLRYAHYQSR
jgi:hypothetical protein